MGCKNMMMLMMVMGMMMMMMMMGMVVGQGGAGGGAGGGTGSAPNPIPFTTCYARCMFFCMIEPQNACSCTSTCLKKCLDTPPTTTTMGMDEHAQNLGYCKLGCATSLCSNISKQQDPEGESMGQCVDACSDKCTMSYHEMAYKKVSDIKPHDNAEPILIRVIRKWKPFWKKEICFLFIDTEGNAIEAKGDLNSENHFNSTITLQECYIVSDYLSDTASSSSNVVPHPACIILGTRTTFTVFNDKNIPRNYFNFADYDQLRLRCDNHLLLTDYIGRMERPSNILNRSNKIMLKITLQDQSESFIEATLWEDVAYSFDREEALKQPQPVILALTSMKVTEYKGSLQLGSTNATTVTVNPDIVELEDIIKRFKEIKGESPTYPILQRTINSGDVERNRLTLEDILGKKPEENARIKFTCLASITDIENYGTWYYESCSQCKKKLIPKEQKLACPDHGEIEDPRYLYCVNATIADNTSSCSVVLFNEPMTTLLGYDCHDMVVREGYTDPHILPAPMRLIRGKPKIFQVQFQTLRKEGSATLRVNNVFEPTPDSTVTTTPTHSVNKTYAKNAKRPLIYYPDEKNATKENRLQQSSTASLTVLDNTKTDTPLNIPALKPNKKQMLPFSGVALFLFEDWNKTAPTRPFLSLILLL
ncbi:hypothetical protein QVD17_11016 [Tagetes erecta]|uniref:Replication factor A C-terminal domain-containing protein n=1 Tax=Tagetes erecta TaxID=13708 RepID=A0AAD8L3W9_TARER|nr:hypothetical protein QVD17_11016 [Tagetes erecta]